jgi:hypothetical protein
VCGGGSNRSAVCEKFFDLIAQNAQNSGAPDPIILAAVGNDGAGKGFEWPARFPSVVAVGSVTHSKDRSTFSNTGTTKAPTEYCMCPGGEEDQSGKVTEYVGEGTDSVGNVTYCVGTSPATAYASSVLALLRHCRSKRSLSVTSGRVLDAADQKAKKDISSYNAADHGMGRLIYDP